MSPQVNKNSGANIIADVVANDNGADVSISLLSITEGENDRGIPIVKFIDDVEKLANAFSPPASAELLIGAYSELHSKFKSFETSLTRKSAFRGAIVVPIAAPSFGTTRN